MLGYLESRDFKVKKLHEIYTQGKEIPELLKELIEIPEVYRLNGIDQNAGINLSGFNIFNYNYSTLDHCLGVALILNNFITKQDQILAALLHDLAVPAFSYSSTYIDEENFGKEDVKLTVYDAIVGSDKLFEYFLKKEISIDGLCDYTKYPLAYNVVPLLCAHRLEYFLHTMYLNNMCTEGEIKEIYDNVIVVANEDNMPEFCFKDAKIAQKFCLLSIKCGEDYRSYEAKATMKFIADTLGTMIRREVISRKDLYTYGDKVIMDMGLNCSDKRISDRWKYLERLNKVYKKFNLEENKYCSKIEADLRYADPLIRLEDGGYIRTSKKYSECKEKINEFLNSDTDLYFYIDY